MADYQATDRPALLRGFRRRSSQLTWLASLALAAVMAAGAVVLEPRPLVRATLLACALLLPLTAVSQVQEAALRGLGHVVEGFSSMILPPALTLILLAVATLAGRP